MPYSKGYLRAEIKEHFIKNCVEHISILDAGAGCGTYSHLLREHFPNIDGLEIYPKYAEMFDLESKYRQFFIGDIRSFDIDEYDYIILGDIIEHLSVEDAGNLLDKIYRKDKLCLVGVPYLFEQGEEYGNIHEIHLQPDLTKEIFLQRYPHMKFLMGNEECGYFVNYDFL